MFVIVNKDNEFIVNVCGGNYSWSKDITKTFIFTSKEEAEKFVPNERGVGVAKIDIVKLF